MKKQIDPKAIVEEIFTIAIEKSVENCGGIKEYPFAFGWALGNMQAIFDQLELSPKQKKILQGILEQKNLTRTKKVENLMTGEMVEIAYNTPHCCDPSSETYWSM